MEIIQVDTLQALTQMEIDTQIATAKQFPRDLKKAISEATEMATMSEEIAEECGYAKPVKKWNEEKGEYEDSFVTGPSVRLAEIFVSCYGNIRSATRVVGQDGRTVTSQARVLDLEKNIGHEENTERSILTKKGKTFPEHMIVTTAKAAASISYRNCVFKVIPAVYVKAVYDAAMKKATPPVDQMPAKRQAAIDYFVSIEVPVEEVLKAIHVKSIDEIGVERLGILRGLATAIKSGESTKEEIFPGMVKDEKGDKAKAATKATENLLKGKK